mmetsp:Transcript_63261/g.135954  ORF Transcript_63261/g.135954 Transcript_63261/m.135954 type:complete len:257 (+) Transcript_63261:124-894(+)
MSASTKPASAARTARKPSFRKALEMRPLDSSRVMSISTAEPCAPSSEENSGTRSEPRASPRPSELALAVHRHSKESKKSTIGRPFRTDTEASPDTLRSVSDASAKPESNCTLSPPSSRCNHCLLHSVMGFSSQCHAFTFQTLPVTASPAATGCAALRLACSRSLCSAAMRACSERVALNAASALACSSARRFRSASGSAFSTTAVRMAGARASPRRRSASKRAPSRRNHPPAALASTPPLEPAETCTETSGTSSSS